MSETCAGHTFQLHYKWTDLRPCDEFIGGIAPNQVIARSEFEVHLEIYTAVIDAYM